MTSNLNRRLEEHRVGTKGFASSYKMTKLVYYETFEGPNAALERERILKKWRREKKIQLIEGSNPQWEELVVENRNGISHPEFNLSERRESKGIRNRLIVHSSVLKSIKRKKMNKRIA